jgi:hypothetical protein
MHSGEEFFIWAWQQYAMILVFLAAYLFLAFAGRLPSMDAFRKFADTINSAGGHILILLTLTVYAIKITMQFFYHVIGLPEESFTKAQTMISMAATTCTGTLIGLPMGALLKTMTGGYNIPKSGDAPANGTAAAPASVPAPAAPAKP